MIPNGQVGCKWQPSMIWSIGFSMAVFEPWSLVFFLAPSCFFETIINHIWRNGGGAYIRARVHCTPNITCDPLPLDGSSCLSHCVHAPLPNHALSISEHPYCQWGPCIMLFERRLETSDVNYELNTKTDWCERWRAFSHRLLQSLTSLCNQLSVGQQSKGLHRLLLPDPESTSILVNDRASTINKQKSSFKVIEPPHSSVSWSPLKQPPGPCISLRAELQQLMRHYLWPCRAGCRDLLLQLANRDRVLGQA